MRKASWLALLVVLLCVAALAGASAYTCNDKLKPGQVNVIRMTSTSFYNGYSTMNFEWDRPKDAINGQGDSCIKGYEVGIIRMDGMRIQSANVPVTIDAKGGSYQAKGLNPGTQYKISVVAIGPTQGNGAPSGDRGPFTSAPSTQICDSNLKPGQVSQTNFRLIQTGVDGNYANIKWEWDRPIDKGNNGLNSCIASYDVAIYNSAGSQFVSANVPVSPDHTKAYYEARGLTPGNPYYISATGRSNTQGQGSPGMKAGPFHAAGHAGGSQPRTADEKGRK